MKKLSAAAAFSLVEVTLAIGIAAFCLIALFGLLPVGVQTNRNASSQTAATDIMASVLADLRATPKNNTTSTQFGISVPSDPTTGAAPSCQPCDSCWIGQTQTVYFDSQGQAVSAGNGRYRLSVTSVQNPSATAAGGAVFMALKVTWPASVDPCATTPSGSTQAFAMVDRK
jgi:type II secretory pathway pseudopilin PulG